jgi:hypothetical protein
MPAPGATCPSGTCSVSLGAGGRWHADRLGPRRVLGHLSVRTEPSRSPNRSRQAGPLTLGPARGLADQRPRSPNRSATVTPGATTSGWSETRA